VVQGEFAVGQTLDGTPYRLTEIIGRGASSVVYRGEHGKLGTRVVVKLMSAAMSADPERAGRMRLEAQALARLAHPNLVAVTDCGIARDRLFFVMDDDGGIALEDALGSAGRMTPEDAVAALGDVLEGLAFIHASGLVHRDLHPNNLLVCPRGDGSRIVRILDLGLVKVLSGHEHHQLGPLPVPTAEGTTLGTPRYMAPEQARGEAVDARSDLYAAGCVLYRLLTGRDPYAHHATTGQVLAAQLSEPVGPPSSLVPEAGIGPALDAALLQALAKAPAARFGSARHMATTLREALASDAATVRNRASSSLPPRPSWDATVSLSDPTPSPAAAVAQAQPQATLVVDAPGPGVADEAPTRVSQAPRLASPERAPGSPNVVAQAAPAAITTSEVTTVRKPTPRDAGATPSVPRAPSRAAVVATFAGSWLGFLVLTLLVLVATRGCGGTAAQTIGGSADGARLSAG
jgi:serine/threonine protein kinase